MKKKPACRRPERRTLYRVLRPYRGLAVIVIVTSILSSVCDVFSIGMLIPLLANIQGMEGGDQLPWILRPAMELLAPYSVSTQISLAIGLVITAILLKNVLLGVSIYFGYKISTGMAADLRTRATAMLLDVGLEYHNRARSGEVIEKYMNNIYFMEDLVRYAVEMIAQIITFLALFSLLFVLSWRLTLVALLIGSVFMWLTFAYTRRLSGIGADFALSSRNLMSSVHEMLSGIHVIKAFVRERSQQERMSERIGELRQNALRLNFGNYAVHLLTDAVGGFAIGGLFLVTMFVVELTSTLLIVILFPFIFVITRIIPVLKQVNLARAMVVSRWPFVKIVHEFLDLDDKPFVKSGDEPYPGLESAIRFENVTFRYTPESNPALRDVSLSLQRGRTTAIVGESGSGKSTLVALLLRYYDTLEGTLYVDDIPLDRYDPKSFRRNVGVVSQDVFIFNDTVRYNIGFGAEIPLDDDRIVEAARRAGADPFIRALPDGYDTVLGDRGVTLSGGQRQRISIARGVLRDPEILVLDEATSSLDTRTEERIHEALAELGRDRTVLIIAHRLSTIENADLIVVMRDGRVVEQGTATELLARDGEFSRLSRRSANGGAGAVDGGEGGPRSP